MIRHGFNWSAGGVRMYGRVYYYVICYWRHGVSEKNMGSISNLSCPIDLPNKVGLGPFKRMNYVASWSCMVSVPLARAMNPSYDILIAYTRPMANNNSPIMVSPSN